MNTEQILDRSAQCGLALTREQADRLMAYHALLTAYNTRMDLTAIVDDQEALDRHYMDSLAPLFKGLIAGRGGSVIDIGTGAGFPGLPLAICRPDMQFILLDALQKRVGFLQEVIDTLELVNVTAVHSRAEDAARLADMRGQFDYACARAVAGLPTLLEYTLPFLKRGGMAILWKGPSVNAEWTDGAAAAGHLGGSLAPPLPVSFPGRDWAHVLVTARKTGDTPARYPRKAGTPKKEPLTSRRPPSP